MTDFSISYRFNFPDGVSHGHEVEIDGERLELINRSSQSLPAWTALGYHQCPNCPLDADTTPHCPVAESLMKPINSLGAFVSYDEVEVVVTTPERVVAKHTSLQRAISSLLGLLVATSGCPHTVYFKPMARFHLPLASEEETIYRATSMYLLGQYFLRKRGHPADWEMADLSTLYKDLQVVNSAMARRLRSASDEDAAVNAIVLLDVFAKALPYTIEESLEEIQYIFRDYLKRAE